MVIVLLKSVKQYTWLGNAHIAEHEIRLVTCIKEVNIAPQPEECFHTTHLARETVKHDKPLQ